jgi:hypothetical protein
MTVSETLPRNKAELESRITSSWSQLEQTIDSLTEEQLTEPRDPAGWSAKDHLAHLAAWERSMVYLLQNQPRHEGLGVEESVYLESEEDDINAVIQQASKDLSLGEVLTLLRTTHEQLRELVSAMSDEDLQQTYSHFLPDEPGRDDGNPILWRISGNTDSHFDAHRGYIEAIVA